MIPKELKTKLEVTIGNIISVQVCSGGSINHAYKIESVNGVYFLKYNSASFSKEMFESECEGLQLLKHENSPSIPELVLAGNSGDLFFILMEHIERAPSTRSFWKNFGCQLANLHMNNQNFFGGEKNNFIGSLKQKNTKHDSWSEFFIHERLIPQWNSARSRGFFDQVFEQHFNNFLIRIPEIFPEEKSSLLHGDLWSGNFIPGKDDTPWLIDPSVYFGHREIDLAMSKLFGGFDPLFYRSYNDRFPLIKGWENRVPYFNLYPLLVHVNLFGSGYTGDVKSTLESF